MEIEWEPHSMRTRRPATRFCLGSIAICATSLAGATAHAAIPAHYATTTIPTPLDIHPISNVTLTGINNSGQAVGSAVEKMTTGGGTTFFTNQPFLYSNGTLTQLANFLNIPTAISTPRAINNAGQIVGDIIPPSNIGVIGTYPPSVIYLSVDTAQSFTATTNTQLFDANGAALGINNLGQVVGYQFTTYLSIPIIQPVMYSNGQKTLIPDLYTNFGSKGAARGINDSGQIVGESTVDSNGDLHAFLYANGAPTDLGTLGGKNSSATAINASGEIVGYADLSNGNLHAFIDANGSMTDIGTLGGAQSYAIGINASRDVVGKSETADVVNNQPVLQAFLYSNGQMIDLDTLIDPLVGGDYLTQAVGINDLGQIAVNGASGSYILTPTPTPRTHLPPPHHPRHPHAPQTAPLTKQKPNLPLASHPSAR